MNVHTYVHVTHIRMYVLRTYARSYVHIYIRTYIFTYVRITYVCHMYVYTYVGTCLRQAQQHTYTYYKQ